MKKFLFLSVILASLFGFNLASAATLYSHTINLPSGWNIISTPKVLESHSFSLPETSDNFDIYALNASSTSGWSTLASLGQTEFTPLFGYFINNKSTTTQYLTLNYKNVTSPNQRLFDRLFTKAGWYSIGVANPTYSKKTSDNLSDTNNPSSVIDSISGKYSSVIDLTDDSYDLNPNGVSVGDSWKQAVATGINSLNDFRDTKGYAIYVTSADALYSGFQNNNLIEPSITVFSPTSEGSYVAGGQIPVVYSANNFPRAVNVAFQLNKNATYPSGPYNPVSTSTSGYNSATGMYALTIPSDITAAGNDYSVSLGSDYPTTETGIVGYSNNFMVNPYGVVYTLSDTPSISKSVIGQTASSTFSTGFTFDVTAYGTDISIAKSGAFFIDVYVNNASVSRIEATYAKPISGVTEVGDNYVISDGTAATFTAQTSFVGPKAPFLPAGGIVTARMGLIISSFGENTSVSDTFRTDNSATVTL